MGKKNIIAVFLTCAIMAGTGIFAFVPQTAKAQAAATSAVTLSIEQLQQMVANLQKMIAQVMQIISQMSQQPSSAVCGNGKCETSESTANCPKDCNTNACSSSLGADLCAKAGGKMVMYEKRDNWRCLCPVAPDCESACGTHRLAVIDNKDCKVTDGFVPMDNGAAACCCQKCDNLCKAAGLNYVDASVNDCKAADGFSPMSSGAMSCCCQKPAADTTYPTCGNNFCEYGETIANCPQDCGQAGITKDKCTTDDDCVNGCNQCFNKSWAANQNQLRLPVAKCMAIAVLSCKCQNNTCTLQAFCGDGTCQAGETVANCPQDCGSSWSKCASKNINDCEKNGGHVFAGNGSAACSCPGKPCYSNQDCVDQKSLVAGIHQYCRFPEEKCSGPGECIENLALEGTTTCGKNNPVCGCDGKSYASDCDLEKANLSKKADGECNAPRPCAKEGEYAALDAASGTRFGCCVGFIQLKTPKGTLCYSETKDEPFCWYIGTEQEGWYYKIHATTGDLPALLKLEKCSGM